jgi:hypothetical protein
VDLKNGTRPIDAEISPLPRSDLSYILPGGKRLLLERSKMLLVMSQNPIQSGAKIDGWLRVLLRKTTSNELVSSHALVEVGCADVVTGAWHSDRQDVQSDGMAFPGIEQ